MWISVDKKELSWLSNADKCYISIIRLHIWWTAANSTQSGCIMVHNWLEGCPIDNSHQIISYINNVTHNHLCATFLYLVLNSFVFSCIRPLSQTLCHKTVADWFFGWMIFLAEFITTGFVMLFVTHPVTKRARQYICGLYFV